MQYLAAAAATLLFLTLRICLLVFFVWILWSVFYRPALSFVWKLIGG